MDSKREEDLIDQISVAYFRHIDPLPELGKIIEEWINQGKINLSSPEKASHAENIFKVTLLFTLSLAVEGGRLENMRFWNPIVIKLFDSLCDTLAWKDQLCSTIQSANYTKWTHGILYLIMQLRQGKWIDESKLDDSCSQTFIDKVTVYLHAVLLMRQGYVLKYWRFHEGERETAELLIFMGIISAYADYVTFSGTWAASEDAVLATRYDILYKQIEKFYLDESKGIFRDLKFSKALRKEIPLRRYLDRDYIHNVRECIYDEFLRGDNARAITQDKTPDIEPVFTCLDNTNPDGWARRFKTFVRVVTNSGPCYYVKKAYGAVRGTAMAIAAIPGRVRGVLQESHNIGCAISDTILLKNFPKTSIPGRVRQGIMILTAPVLNSMGFRDISIFGSILYGMGAVAGLGVQLVRGIYCSIYTVQTRDLRMLTREGRLEFQAPRLPAMLIRERNASGTHDTIYKVHQLPSVNLVGDFGKAFNEQKPVYYGGAGDLEIDNSQGATNSIPLKDLYDMLKNGYVIEELPDEMQNYIKKAVDTGKVSPAGKSFDTMRITSGKDYTQTIIAQLPDAPHDFNKARFVEDGPVTHLLLPETKTLIEALFSAPFSYVANMANPGEGDQLLNVPSLSPLPQPQETTYSMTYSPTVMRRRKTVSRRRRKTVSRRKKSTKRASRKRKSTRKRRKTKSKSRRH